MKAFLQGCAMAWILALPACGGSAEGNTEATTAINVPLNPLPLSERN